MVSQAGGCSQWKASPDATSYRAVIVSPSVFGPFEAGISLMAGMGRKLPLTDWLNERRLTGNSRPLGNGSNGRFFEWPHLAESRMSVLRWKTAGRVERRPRHQLQTLAEGLLSNRRAYYDRMCAMIPYR